MAIKEIRVPDLGSFKDVVVIELLVKPGDTLEVDTPIATLETEKATMDVPSPSAGVLKSLHIERGAKVNTGDLAAVIEADESAVAAGAAETVKPASTPPAASLAAPPPVAAATPVASAQLGSASAPAGAAIPGARTDLAPIQEAGFSRAHAGPSVRRLARELGVDLGRVRGSGLKGRITHDDVKAWVKQALQGGFAAAAPALPKVPVVDHAAFGPIDTQPLSRVRRISGPRLHASWVNIPHVTQFDEADISALEEKRQALKAEAAAKGVKLTPLAFIVAACARALKKFPNFNASLSPSTCRSPCPLPPCDGSPAGLLMTIICSSIHSTQSWIILASAALIPSTRGRSAFGSGSGGTRIVWPGITRSDALARAPSTRTCPVRHIFSTAPCVTCGKRRLNQRSSRCSPSSSDTVRVFTPLMR